jgi:tRNA threonylcarbamoyladenosine biosynthesis protein TsaB
MIVLALDTCLSACSVAVVDGERVLARASEPMARGHQERLAPMAEAVMTAAGIGFDRLERIAVTVGPGSFTGLRVGLAFAKGLALALDIPCVGIGTLEALAETARDSDQPGAPQPGAFVVACQDAGRGQAYIQAFIDGRPAMAPDAVAPGEAAARIAELWPGGPTVIAGSGAPLLADIIHGATLLPDLVPDPVAVARLAARVRSPAPPRPLYLRAPDARLPAA